MTGFVIPKRVKRWLLASAWVGGTIIAVACLAFAIGTGRLIWHIANMGR